MVSFRQMAHEMVPPMLGFPSGRQLWGAHSTLPKAAASLGELARRREPPARLLNLVSYNTFLMKIDVDVRVIAEQMGTLVGGAAHVVDWLGMVDLDFVPIASKPQVPLRNVDIGQALGRLRAAQGPTVAALCEVWTAETRNKLVEESKGAGSTVDVVAGPDPAEAWRRRAHLPGSGLAVLGLGVKVTAGASHTFEARGIWAMDSDWWASKGVMLSHVDTGIGTIDLYTAHLHSGGDLPQDNALFKMLVPWARDPTDTEKDAVRLAQVKEVVEFIKATHHESHVAILTGDFNITARPEGDNFFKPTLSPTYLAATELLGKVGLADVWERQYGFWNRGATTAGEPGSQIPEICSFAGDFTGKHEKVCSEPQSDQQLGTRIDYLFVERPTSKHSFTVDPFVLRRLPFLRPPRWTKVYSVHGKTPGLIADPKWVRINQTDPPFGSDHLALQTTLLCSPRG